MKRTIFHVKELFQIRNEKYVIEIHFPYTAESNKFQIVYQSVEETNNCFK